MSRRDAIDSLFLQKRTAPAPAPKSGDRVRSGAVAAMGASLQEAAEAAKAAEVLQRTIQNGETIIRLDPALIDEMTIADRIPAVSDPHFTQLVESMKAHGQQSPILVRPHAAISGRYEVAYGRRRLRAAAALGVDVRAIVKPMSDAELVVAQGRENLDRQDLSFIEKARFAMHLEDAGLERRVILDALATDKADLSRYITLARSLPLALIDLIGPAPKVGRARWQALATHVAEAKGDVLRIAKKAVDGTPDSDARFAAVLAACQKAPQPRDVEQWRSADGAGVATIHRKKSTTAIILDERAAPAFADFIASRLDALFAEFSAQRREES